MAVLTKYVQTGGNVYLAAGTGNFGSAAAEAAVWNPFLNEFGLHLASSFNCCGMFRAANFAHPLFENVTTLYVDGGQFVQQLDPSDPHTRLYDLYGPNQAGFGLYQVCKPGDDVDDGC